MSFEKKSPMSVSEMEHLSATIDNLQSYAENHRFFCEIGGREVFYEPNLDEANAFTNWYEAHSLALELAPDGFLRSIILERSFWSDYAERVLLERVANGTVEPVVEHPFMLPPAYYGEIIPR